MAHLTQEYVDHLYNTFGDLKVLDDIIRHRAADEPPVPILGYPRYDDSVDDFEQFTGQQLDRFVDATCKHYLASGLKANTNEAVGILAASNVDFIVTFFALSRLGYSVLCLSLRIAPVAVVNLLKQTGCRTIVHGYSQQVESTILAASQDLPIRTLRVPERRVYDVPSLSEPRFVRQYDRESERDKIALIMHSSGSTGLPKPVFLSHRNVLCHPVQGAGLHNFGALPLYHMYGVSTMLQAMYMKKTANIFNVLLPLTAENLIAAIEAVRPEVIHVVPYALGLLAEQPRGVAYLKTCKAVTAAGARTPDELGDRLTKEGVNLGLVFGTTEAGLAGDSMRREKGDDSWDYIRFYQNVRKYVHMDPLGDGLYECVYLKGHPGLSTSNSDDPAPGSFRSKDIFVPHPTLPDKWKYVTRLDDRITLVNGEKVLPLPIEGCIRESDLVREAVVVGVDKPMPGLLAFKSRSADGMSNDEYIDAIWPVVEVANSRAESFSQITKDMIYVFASNVEYPRTDKGSIIRAQVYKVFAEQINEMYATLEEAHEGSLKLDVPGIEAFLKDTYEQIIGAPLASVETDFFTAGVDSLKAIQMRRIIQKTLDLRGHQLSRNVVYERRNPKELARYLYSLSSGKGTKMNGVNGVNGANGANGIKGESKIINQMINKYSDFGQTAIITGATGSMGAHALAQMVSSSRFNRVYCFVRGANPMQRVLDSLETRCITLSSASKRKIVALEYDVSLPDFGLGETMMEKFKAEVTLILHIAWPVNFNIPLQTFEPHLAGLYNLLKLSMTVHRPLPAQLFFCSSISVALNTPPPASVPESAIEDFHNTGHTGYAQSKVVGEHMVLNAARTGARSYVLRIGQVVGDTENGVWNDNEFIPAMIRSALSMKMLPALKEHCSWVPVDCLATAILELAETREQSPLPVAQDSNNPPVFYNIVNPRGVPWDDVLRELKVAGLNFNTVPFEEWLRELRKSAARGQEKINPAVKLIEYFEEHYASNLSSQNGYEGSGVTFVTQAAERDSAMMRSLPTPVEGNAIQKYVARWLPRWSKS
ncbi:acetyl-CoA synthetase-like protein [Hypomontagnella submonticulosa]|nr:acetyl-CoA synthetase-like protein [Hypomontagnella submonticulosa]